ncbi:Gfo/Idh/MocA family protein [Pseudonocardia endophytica]|nr:Gfo/Idh/MocA family oxidoreductase [Pseudonocardia endophytica]
MTSERLRIGLVGAGPWAWRVHAPSLTQHPWFRFQGVWTRRPEAAGDLCDEFGGRPYRTLDELVDDTDVIAFAVPPAVQAELAPDVAAAGRHLVLEKPLGEDLAGARRVADAVAAAGVHSTTVLVLRFDDAVLAWLDGIGPGPAGQDTVGVARWLSGSLLGGPYHRSAWRAEHGALLDIGPHVIDLLDTALGPVTGVDMARRTDPDVWRVGLAHAGGARSTMTLSLRLPVDPTEMEFGVFGPAGRHVLRARSDDATTCYGRMLDELAFAVGPGRPGPAVDAARALRLQEIVDEIRGAAG